MKKLVLLLLISVTTSIVAQTSRNCGQRIGLQSDCNRSWSYNNDRFYRLIWEGMMNGKIKAYTGYEGLKSVSTSDLYYKTIDAITHSYELEGIYDQPIPLRNRADSMRILSPNYIEILGKYDAGKSPARMTKEWVKIVCVYEPEFSYQLSYTELTQYLDQTKAYWVNPYYVSDSVSFSKALEEERYVFEWLGLSDEEAYKSSGYISNMLPANDYVFKGRLTRYASILDKPNRPYYITRPSGNLISVIMQAYVSGKIKGYGLLDIGADELPVETFNNKMIEVMGNPDWLYMEEEEGRREISLNDYIYFLDLFGIQSYVELYDSTRFLQSLHKERQEYFFIGTGASNPYNYKGIGLPYIAFDYNDVMKVLEASGLTWYAIDNQADSCSFATAIKTNKVYWRTSVLSDLQNDYIYGFDYDQDSSKVDIAYDRMDDCIKNIVANTLSSVVRKMNVRCAGQDYPSLPHIPLYLHYTGYRYLDPAEDSTLFFLTELVPYLVSSAMDGKVTLYNNDSLNARISVEEFTERISIKEINYDEEGNEVEKTVMLAPENFTLVKMTADIQVNAKEKVLIKDKSIQLYISPEHHPAGIAVPIASISYTDLVALLKSDKKVKAYLKKLDATLREKRYRGLLNVYGEYTYDYWNVEMKEEQLKKIHKALLPYIQ